MTEASSSEPAPSANSGSAEDAPYPTSFAQIVELISTGQPIPGIKEIPNTILEGQSSQSTTSKRKKPWEKDEPDVAAADTSISGEQVAVASSGE